MTANGLSDSVIALAGCEDAVYVVEIGAVSYTHLTLPTTPYV